MDPTTPLTYVEVFREEHNPQGWPRFVAEPEDNFNRLITFGDKIPWESPTFLDPLRFSDYYADGKKIHPVAQMRITENTALGSYNSNSDEEFKIGKLLGYLYAAMHQGGQRPIDIRGNLQEATPTTFGSLYEVSPTIVTPGPAYTSAGFDLGGIDGYPY